MKTIYISLFILLGCTYFSEAASYFSAATGNWSSSSTWASVCGGAGGAGVPGAGDNVTLCSGYTVSVTANASVSNITITSGGTLKTGTSGGGANKTLTVSGTFTIQNGGIYIHNNNQVAATTIFAGTESFAASSTIQVDKWSDTQDSLCGGVSSDFGNLIFNWDTGMFLWKNSGLGTVRQIAGNLTTNLNCATYLDNSSMNITATIGGNLTVGDEFRVKTTNGGNATLNVGGTLSLPTADGFFLGVYQANGNFTLNANTVSVAGGTFYGIYNGDGNASFNITTYSQTSGSFLGIRNTATFTAGTPSYTINTLNFTGGYFIGNSSCNTSAGNIVFNVTGNINITFGDTSALFAINRLATLSSTPTACSLTMNVGGNITISGANGEFNSNNGTGFEDINITGKLTVNMGKIYFNVIPGFGSNGHSVEFQAGGLEVNGGALYLSSESGALTAGITGSTAITGGTLSVKANKGIASFTCGSTYTQSGGNLFLYNNASIASTDVTSVFVNGNFSHSAGVINFSNNTLAANGTNVLYINGATYTISGTGSMTRSGAGTGTLFGELRFSRPGTISFNRAGSHSIQQVKQVIASGTEVDVVSGDVQVASHATAATDFFTITSGGILSLRSKQVFSNALAANSGITVADGGRLRTQHASGLYNNSTAAAISNAGNMNFFLGSNSIVEYYGTSTQVLSGINIGIATGSQHKYGILEINFSGPANTSWVYPTASPSATTAIYIRTELRLTAGELNLSNASSTVSSGGRTINIESAAANSITRTNGYIKSETHDMSAAVIRNTGSSGSYLMPFGYNSTEYIPVTFTVTSGAPGNVTFATYHTNADNLPWPPSVTNLNSGAGLTPDNRDATVDRYWVVSAAGSAQATIIFNYTSSELPASPYNNASQMKAHRFNTSSSFWDAFLPGQSAVAYNVTVPSAGTFGTWAIANILSPLPIELLFFHAKKEDHSVQLHWATASEKDNDYFIIERTQNQASIGQIAIIDGNGTSSQQINYSYADINPLKGISYYRLVQVDYNGDKWYSHWIAVNFNKNVAYIYPNPASEKLYLIHNTGAIEKLYIYDCFGRLVNNALPASDEIDISMLSAGSYFLQVHSETQELMIPFKVK